MTAATKPRWIDAYETASGMPDPRLAGTAAKPRHCKGCGLLVLAGFDAPLIAHLAIVDPYAATPVLEAAAVILDIPTYRLHGMPGGYELAPRFIPGQTPSCTHAAAGGDVVVVLAHVCGRRPLATIALPTRASPGAAFDSAGPPPF